MNKDISGMLSEWDYDPSAVTARYITNEEGSTFIQLRLDLGIFQMHTEGRPDGSRPRGCDSSLQYYQRQQRTTAGMFRLDNEACSELQQEAQQFYYRYLSGFKLEDYRGVIRDTSHNIDLFEFVDRFVDSDEVCWEFLQYMPYVLMMQARAKAEIAVRNNLFEEAAEILTEVRDRILAFWDEQGDPLMKTESYEIEVLSHLIEKYREGRTLSPMDDLRDELNYAVSVEDFEKAAELRDKLKVLESQPV